MLINCKGVPQEDLLRQVKENRDETLTFSGLFSRAQDELVALIQVLQGSAVTMLRLSFNGLGHKSGDELVALIQALQNTPVTTLILSFNGLCYKSGDELFALIQALQGSAVTTLDLSFNELYRKTGDEWAALIQALRGTPVTTLKLSRNGLCDKTVDEWVALIQALQGSAVNTLDLSGNRLGQKSGDELVALIQALRDTAVTTLKLSDNWLVDKTGDEWVALMAALQGTTVTTLDLQRNTFSSEIVKVLVQAVLTNPSHLSATTILLETDLHPFVIDVLVDEYATLIQTGPGQGPDDDDDEVVLDVGAALTFIEQVITVTRCFGVTAPKTIMSGVHGILLQLLAPTFEEEVAGETPESIQGMQARLLRLTRVCLQSLTPEITPPEIVINIIERMSQAFASPLFTGEVARRLGINGYAFRVAILDEVKRLTGHSMSPGYEEGFSDRHTAMIWYAEKGQQDRMGDDKKTIAGQAAKDDACCAALYHAYNTLYSGSIPVEVLEASRLPLQEAEQTQPSTPLEAQIKTVETSQVFKQLLDFKQRHPIYALDSVTALASVIGKELAAKKYNVYRARYEGCCERCDAAGISRIKHEIFSLDSSSGPATDIAGVAQLTPSETSATLFNVNQQRQERPQQPLATHHGEPKARLSQ